MLNSYRKLPEAKRHVDPNTRQPHLSYAGYFALMWWQTNLAAETVLRRKNPSHYKRMRYEDFAQYPMDSVKQILDFIGESALLQEIQFETERRVLLGSHAIIQGNIHSRRVSNVVEIVPNIEWRSQLEQRSRVIMRLLTFPLMLHYGYFRGAQVP